MEMHCRLKQGDGVIRGYLSRHGSPLSQMSWASSSADMSATVLFSSPTQLLFFLQELPLSHSLPFMIDRRALGP